MRKNFDVGRCTASGAVDAVQIVKCGWSNAGRWEFGRGVSDRMFLETCLRTEGLTRIRTDETDLRTDKSKNNDEIQGSFTAFRMTTKDKRTADKRTADKRTADERTAKKFSTTVLKQALRKGGEDACGSILFSCGVSPVN
jgi:hypothetical protein